MSPTPRSRYPSPTASSGWALWRVALAWQRRVRAALEPLGLTHAQFVVLATTWWLTHNRPGAPTQRQVAEHAGTDPMTTSQIIRRLRDAGYLDRRPDPDDRRAQRLSLTAHGAQLLEASLTAVEMVDAAFFEPLGDRQPQLRTQLIQLLPLLTPQP